MDDYVKTWLFDIKSSIEEIDSFFSDGKQFQYYQQDLKLRRAVERNIEIIGEAMTRILKANLKIEYLIHVKL